MPLPFHVIPSIDIRGGRCVRLFQGDYDQETVYDDDPLAVAGRWAALGGERLHVVDLDASRAGVPVNFDLIATIIRAVGIPVQVGGGIRDEATVRRYRTAGAARVVLGAAAVHQPDLVERLCRDDADGVVVALDTRDGLVRVQGWTEDTGVAVETLAHQMCQRGVVRFLVTDISVDGTLTQPNYDLLRTIVNVGPAAVIASGGMASVGQLPHVLGTGAEAAILGKALYTGAIDLAAAVQCVRDLSASHGR